MAGVVHISWYATVLRQESLGEAVAEAARISLHYGAHRYAVHRSLDDRYRILQMTWFESKDDWYRYWEGPEMIEFRARNLGRYQVPIVYVWHDELAAGELGPQVENGNGADAPAPQPEPQAAV
jgi:hypothetical protein